MATIPALVAERLRLLLEGDPPSHAEDPNARALLGIIPLVEQVRAQQADLTERIQQTAPGPEQGELIHKRGALFRLERGLLRQQALIERLMTRPEMAEVFAILERVLPQPERQAEFIEAALIIPDAWRAKAARATEIRQTIAQSARTLARALYEAAGLYQTDSIKRLDALIADTLARTRRAWPIAHPPPINTLDLLVTLERWSETLQMPPGFAEAAASRKRCIKTDFLRGFIARLRERDLPWRGPMRRAIALTATAALDEEVSVSDVHRIARAINQSPAQNKYRTD